LPLPAAGVVAFVAKLAAGPAEGFGFALPGVAVPFGPLAGVVELVPAFGVGFPDGAGFFAWPGGVVPFGPLAGVVEFVPAFGVGFPEGAGFFA
jgi:hypothetical protein